MALIDQPVDTRCTNRRTVGVSLLGVEVEVAGNTFRCCRACAVRMAWIVQEQIQGGLGIARDGSYVGFLTLTEGLARPLPDHARAVGYLLQDVRRYFGDLTGSGRKRSMPYYGVREVQGARLMRDGEVVWHTHVLVKDWPRCDLRHVQELAEHQGFGRAGSHVKATRVAGDGSAGMLRSLPRYMSKVFAGYLTKGVREGTHALTVSLLPKRHRLVTYSHDWWPGHTMGSLTQDRLCKWRAERPLATYERRADGRWNRWGPGEQARVAGDWDDRFAGLVEHYDAVRLVERGLGGQTDDVGSTYWSASPRSSDKGLVLAPPGYDEQSVDIGAAKAGGVDDGVTAVPLFVQGE